MLSFLSSLSFVITLLAVLNVAIVVVDGFQSYSQQYNHHPNRRIINQCQEQQQQQQCPFFPRNAITSSISVSVSVLASTNDNNNDSRPEQDLDNNESDLEYILRLKEYSNKLMTDAKTGDYLKQDVEKEDDNANEDKEREFINTLMTNNSKDDGNNTTSTTTEKDEKKKEKSIIGKYVRAEEWDAEQRRRSKGGELSWEERVQYDGQQGGNKYKQNDILRKNLF